MNGNSAYLSKDNRIDPPHPASAPLGHPLPVGERNSFLASLSPKIGETLADLLSPTGRGWPSGAEAG
jgi:hypothetical protein